MTAWRGIIEDNLTRHRDDPSARLLHLATVRTDGAPAVRTVVFRGFTSADGLRLTSDLRAAKVKHLAHDARAELSWYFAGSRIQVRIAGKVGVYGPDVDDEKVGAERTSVWSTLSDEVRSGFVGGHPGRPLDGTPIGSVPEATAPPPETFALLVLAPERIDVVELQPRPHRRTLYARDAAGRWHARAINP